MTAVYLGLFALFVGCAGVITCAIVLIIRALQHKRLRPIVFMVIIYLIMGIVGGIICHKNALIVKNREACFIPAVVEKQI